MYPSTMMSVSFFNMRCIFWNSSPDMLDRPPPSPSSSLTPKFFIATSSSASESLPSSSSSKTDNAWITSCKVCSSIGGFKMARFSNCSCEKRPMSSGPIYLTISGMSSSLNFTLRLFRSSPSLLILTFPELFFTNNMNCVFISYSLGIVFSISARSYVDNFKFNNTYLNSN